MSPTRNHLRYIAFILIIAISFVFPIATGAHEIKPISASPAEGGILQQAPEQARLIFEEEIAEEGSTLQVFDDQNKQVDLGGGGVDLNDPKHTALVVGLPALTEGVYLVKWQVTLLDGDASHGEYYFGIGNVTLPKAPADEPEKEAEPETQTGSPVWLWAALVGGAILIAAVVIFWVRKARSKP
jgi:copper resistance protein C